MAAPYPEVPQQPDYPSLEERVLAFWAEDGTFAASVQARPGGDNEYVFYDGPPFANGLPHYGHLLTGFVKDAVPRYQTMRGRRVERRFGWDCHGLPAEMEAEKELEMTGRAAIMRYGIARFNDYCRSLVQRTTDAWERYVTRQARWVDFARSYRTMDLSYMESVMWAFKRLHDSGLVYEGERVLPYCWECETPLSNFETRQDDAYRPREDQVVTVSFELNPSGPGPAGPGPTGPNPAGTGSPGSAERDKIDGPLHLLVWTTTPWTLPSNLALAVGDDIVYAVYDLDGGLVVLAEACVGAYGELIGEREPVAKVKGERLVGRTYRPLFDFFSGHEGAFRVLAGPFVAVDEGTGIVHMAPGFGEEDYDLCREAGIAVVCPVDDQGRFTAEVPPYAGRNVFDANAAIRHDLKAQGALVSTASYTHSYPHCWRTDTPLIYKAVDSWFVNVLAIRDRMLELNERINWIPGHVREGAFGKWLEQARDWSISRNRFWGAPIPVWESDDPRYPRTDVYGSLDELERDFGVRPTDLHRPAIDELTRPNPDDPTGRSTMRRTGDVLDCWFESGSMPFAQVHFPVENASWFEEHFPADFIVEYIGQTRGWFYTMHVLSTALFDRPPFENCIVHGIIQGDDGRKMSKHLGNYPDPDMVFARWGADAMRWFLLSSSILRGQDLVVHARGFEDAVRHVLNPIWNTWYFFSLYANVDQIHGEHRTDPEGVLDRYMLAKTSALVAAVTAHMDGYDLYGACSDVVSYLDALTNWYVRRSRNRFWRARDGSPEVESDKRDAYDTLSTALSTLCRVVAPLLPMLAESIYQGLTGERSVHLADWPSTDELVSDPRLVAEMELVREVCSAGHAIRKASDKRLRLPLQSLMVAGPRAPELKAYVDLIADEVNVKEVVLTDDVSGVADEVLTVVPAAIGPRLGSQTQKVIAAVKRGDWSRRDNGEIDAAGEVLFDSEYNLLLRPRDPSAARALPDRAGVVRLDTETTEDLEREGLARDLVRLVQSARRDAGLHISDRIHLELSLPEPMAKAAEEHRVWVMEQTLAVSMTVTVSDSVEIDLKSVNG
ncbi:MAG: isoleucine--tRNA ligase [Acidimicrobiales bacterium]